MLGEDPSALFSCHSAGWLAGGKGSSQLVPRARPPAGPASPGQGGGENGAIQTFPGAITDCKTLHPAFFMEGGDLERCRAPYTPPAARTGPCGSHTSVVQSPQAGTGKTTETAAAQWSLGSPEPYALFTSAPTREGQSQFGGH